MIGDAVVRCRLPVSLRSTRLSLRPGLAGSAGLGRPGQRGAVPGGFLPACHIKCPQTLPRVRGKTLAHVLFYEPGGTRRLPVSAAGVLCGRRDRPTGDPKRPDTTPEPACVPGTVYCIGNCVTVRLFGRSCGNTSSRTGASDDRHGAPRRRSVACRVLQSRCVPWRSTR